MNYLNHFFQSSSLPEAESVPVHWWQSVLPLQGILQRAGRRKISISQYKFKEEIRSATTIKSDRMKIYNYGRIGEFTYGYCCRPCSQKQRQYSCWYQSTIHILH